MSYGFDDSPPPLIEDIRAYLIDRCYQPARANAIATYCWLWLTAEGCPEFLDEQDRREVQYFLDGGNEVAWNDHDHFIWSISETRQWPA